MSMTASLFLATALISIGALAFSKPIAAPPPVWTAQELHAYGQRAFIELEQLMIERHQYGLLAQVGRQEHDLKGCRALHRGAGALSEWLACVNFVNNERVLNLRSPGAALLNNDLTLLCQKLIKSESDVRTVARSRALLSNSNQWLSCTDRAWRQVYLTAAARFEAEPVAVLAYVRTAEAGLPHQSSWATRTLKLIQDAKVAQSLK